MSHLRNIPGEEGLCPSCGGSNCSVPSLCRSASTVSTTGCCDVCSETLETLTVFQAAPLVCRLCDGKLGYHPMIMLDSAHERKILAESLRDSRADIVLRYEEATTDRLGAFLAKKESRVLHFSGHGGEGFLAVENGWGQMHPLTADSIKEWISLGGHSLQFVFVAACHSRKAGDAFVDAGVPHVVCCDQDALNDIAAVEFEKAFYRALFCGCILQEAFQWAKQAVLNTPRLPFLSREELQMEVEKFVLLPEDSEHKVRIFQEPRPPFSRRRSLVRDPSVAFPPPPQLFLGRELEMFHVVDALKEARLVRVSGEKGAGKAGLVMACCRYIHERRSSFSIDEILWVPSEHQDMGSELSAKLSDSFRELFEYLNKESDVSGEYFRKEASDIVDPIVQELRHSSTLLVIDTRYVLLSRAFSKLSLFVEDLLSWSEDVKVIVVHRPGDEIFLSKMLSPEADIEVLALNFETTVALFGRMCRHVSNGLDPRVRNAGEFSQLMRSGHRDDLRTKRGSEIYKMMGSGIPGSIHNAARNMTESEYAKLIELGLREVPQFEFKSLVELEHQLKDLKEKMNVAVDLENYGRALELQVQCEEVEFLAKEFPSLDALTRRHDELESEIKDARRAGDLQTAKDKDEELRDVVTKIQTERESLELFGLGRVDEDERKPEAVETWACLESCIRGLRQGLEKARQERDYTSAEEFDVQLAQALQRQSSLPTIEEISSTLASLESQRMCLEAGGMWRKAAFIQGQIEKWDERLVVELGVAAEEGIELPQRYRSVGAAEDNAEPQIISSANVALSPVHDAGVQNEAHATQIFAASIEVPVQALPRKDPPGGYFQRPSAPLGKGEIGCPPSGTSVEEQQDDARGKARLRRQTSLSQAAEMEAQRPEPRQIFAEPTGRGSDTSSVSQPVAGGLDVRPGAVAVHGPLHCISPNDEEDECDESDGCSSVTTVHVENTDSASEGINRLPGVAIAAELVPDVDARIEAQVRQRLLEGTPQACRVELLEDARPPEESAGGTRSEAPVVRGRVLKLLRALVRRRARARRRSEMQDETTSPSPGSVPASDARRPDTSTNATRESLSTGRVTYCDGGGSVTTGGDTTTLTQSALTSSQHPGLSSVLTQSASTTHSASSQRSSLSPVIEATVVYPSVSITEPQRSTSRRRRFSKIASVLRRRSRREVTQQ